jgi:hypothetical protein
MREISIAENFKMTLAKKTHLAEPELEITWPELWEADTIEKEKLSYYYESAYDRETLNSNMELAAEMALQLIESLGENAGIMVAEAYLKIENKSAFRILLYVNQPDYHSPNMALAKMHARELTQNETGIDVSFTFSNMEQNTMKSKLAESGYVLKYAVNKTRQAEW